MSEANKALVRALVDEIQNNHRLDRMPEYFEANFANHAEHGAQSAGEQTAVERAQAMFSQLFAAFPDFHATIHQQLAEGDRVVTFKTMHGTHHGSFMGIAPTGRTVSFAVIDIVRIENGKVVEHWAVQDRAAFMQQLGA